jgi:hypothetical protein
MTVEEKTKELIDLVKIMWKDDITHDDAYECAKDLEKMVYDDHND